MLFGGTTEQSHEGRVEVAAEGPIQRPPLQVFPESTGAGPAQAAAEPGRPRAGVDLLRLGVAALAPRADRAVEPTDIRPSRGRSGSSRFGSPVFLRRRCTARPAFLVRPPNGRND